MNAAMNDRENGAPMLPAGMLKLKTGRFTCLVLAGIFAATALPSTTHAQVSQVESSPKASIGFGLIGAELGFVLPAAFGMRETWPYVVFPIVGGGLGAVLGHFALQTSNASPNPELSATFLAVGIALIIPTLVFTLAQTSYDPADDASPNGESTEPAAEDYGDETNANPSGSAPADGSPANQGSDGTTPAAGPTSRLDVQRRTLAVGGGLVRVSDGNVLLTVPAIHTLPLYTAEDARAFGLRDIASQTEVRVPLLSAAF